MCVAAARATRRCDCCLLAGLRNVCGSSYGQARPLQPWAEKPGSVPPAGTWQEQVHSRGRHVSRLWLGCVRQRVCRGQRGTCHDPR